MDFHRTAMACAVAAACSVPVAARAELDWVPYVGLAGEYNSNVFGISGADEAREQLGDDERADSLTRLTGGVDLKYLLGQQTFSALAEGRKVQYNRFNQLDHTEHHYAAGLDYKLGSIIDGALSYDNEERMASLANIDSSELSVEREKVLGGTFNILVHPEWKIETGAKTRTQELPLPLYPDFELSEDSVNAALKYLGFQRLAAGVYWEYVDGEYSGVPDASQFDQSKIEATADYAVSGLTTLHAAAGTIKRSEQSGEGGDLSGFTGELGYSRILTGKTSVNARTYKRISSYTAGANALDETGAEAGLRWLPSTKVTVTGKYSWTRYKFEDSSDVADAGRSDTTNEAQLELLFAPRPWVGVRHYLNYVDRSSNVDRESYKAFVFGIDFMFRFGQKEAT
jgi:hypothetical protein